jgi:autotransporter-associated beta strand protein
MPDPTPNAVKLSNYLTVSRLNGISGTGGYLTPAATGEIWSFPAGGEWLPEVMVGLRVTNHNPTGIDTDLGALTSFQHNLVVDGGATVNLGSAPFTFGPPATADGLGSLQGNGTVLASRGLSVTVGGRIAPGMSDIGTLTVDRLNLAGALEIEGNATATDVLRVVGDLVLGATSQLTVPAGSILGARNYRIVSADTSTGTFGTASVAPSTHTLSYSRPGEVWLSYGAGNSLLWKGDTGNQWSFTAQNWQSPTVFQDGDRVVFDDTATGSRNITLSGGELSPASVKVDTATNYTITSNFAGSFAGTGELVKTGTGTLTLAGPANFEGGVIVQQGILQTTAPNSIPDIGKVVIDAGAQLNLGAVEAIDELIVSGGVASSAPLTVNTLRLQGAASFQAPLVLQNKLVKSGAPLTVAQPIDLAGGTRTIQVATSSVPELTLAGAITNGGLEKTGPGTLALSGLNNFASGIIIRDGTLRALAVGAIPTNTNVTIAGGTLDLNAIPHSLGALNTMGLVVTGGATLAVTSLSGSGGIVLGAGVMQVAQSGKTRYDGNITGTGMMIKAGPGSLALGGTNAITGGTIINDGFLRIAGTAAATVGTITVNGAGALVADETISAPIVLAGGTIGARFEEPAITGDLTAQSGTLSKIMIADPEDPATPSEFVIHGRLRGSGEIFVEASSNGKSADINQGMRLRGAAPSDFTGTITLGQRVKMELQSSVAGPFSPAGSGKIVMFAGDYVPLSQRSGTYSQLNLRNNFAGNTILGNDVEILGPGYVSFGPVSDPNGMSGQIAPANSRIILGNLRIGANQGAAVNKNASVSQIVEFSSVTLTGGNATFAPAPPDFGFDSTSDLALGPILWGKAVPAADS